MKIREWVRISEWFVSNWKPFTSSAAKVWHVEPSSPETGSIYEHATAASAKSWLETSPHGVNLAEHSVPNRNRHDPFQANMCIPTQVGRSVTNARSDQSWRDAEIATENSPRQRHSRTSQGISTVQRVTRARHIYSASSVTAPPARLAMPFDEIDTRGSPESHQMIPRGTAAGESPPRTQLSSAYPLVLTFGFFEEGLVCP